MANFGQNDSSASEPDKKSMRSIDPLLDQKSVDLDSDQELDLDFNFEEAKIEK